MSESSFGMMYRATQCAYPAAASTCSMDLAALVPCGSATGGCDQSCCHAYPVCSNNLHMSCRHTRVSAHLCGAQQLRPLVQQGQGPVLWAVTALICCRGAGSWCNRAGAKPPYCAPGATGGRPSTSARHSLAPSLLSRLSSRFSIGDGLTRLSASLGLSDALIRLGFGTTSTATSAPTADTVDDDAAAAGVQGGGMYSPLQHGKLCCMQYCRMRIDGLLLHARWMQVSMAGCAMQQPSKTPIVAWHACMQHRHVSGYGM